MTKDLNWSIVNTSLFNLCFRGRAQGRNISARCATAKPKEKAAQMQCYEADTDKEKAT